MRLCHTEQLFPQWLITLREHRYDIDRIADPDKRRSVMDALQRNHIETLRSGAGRSIANRGGA